MPNVTITIPDAAVDRVKAAYGGGTNAAVLQQVKNHLAHTLRQHVKDYEANEARVDAEKGVTEIAVS